MISKLKFSFIILFALYAEVCAGQIGTLIPSSRRTNWEVAGVEWAAINYTIGATASTFDEVIDVTNHTIVGVVNADPTGVADCSAIIQLLVDYAETQALAAVGTNANYLTLLYFPPGTYRFDGPIGFDYGHVVIRGANPSYTFFNYSANTHFFRIDRTQVTSDQTIQSKDLSAKTITLTSAPVGIAAGDYIELKKDMNEADLCNVPGSKDDGDDGVVTNGDCEFLDGYEYGQVVKVTSVSGNTITIEDAFAIDYYIETPGTEYDFRAQKLDLIEMVGIEDVKINYTGTVIGGHNFNIKYAVNCWVSGVECNNTGHAHISIGHCSHITSSGCYLHHAIDYDSGPGYGVWIGDKSTNVLIENNIITNMRHSVVLSTSMPCRNVIGYNFTDEPMAPGVEDEIDFHGYFPTLNLIEGNVTGNLTFDTYWGYNGIYNTIFRNSISQYNRNYTLRTNSTGNKYIAYNFNNDDGLLFEDENCDPTCTEGTYADKSYYKTAKPAFISSCYSWPPIGPEVSTSTPITGTIPAEIRHFSGGQMTINPKDEFTDHSIQNNGLISAFNAIAENPAVIYRNRHDLSRGSFAGCAPFYYNANGYWNVGPVTTAKTAASGNFDEEIISSYNNTSNTAAIYSSTSKTNPPVLLWDNGGSAAFVTAISSGNFWGDAKDELIFAIVESNIPKIYVTDDYSNLEKYLIYSGTSGTRIDALATGNFDTDSYAELLIGQNESGNNSRIYKRTDLTPVFSGSVWTLSAGLGSTIWTNTNGYWDVDALAVGDFDGNGDDELIEGFNSSDGPSIYRSETGTSAVTLIYDGSNYWTLAAIAAGDLDNNGDDEMITGFNSNSESPNLYKSEDGLSAGEVLIYDEENIYWHLVSLAIEKVYVSPIGSRDAEKPEHDSDSEIGHLSVFPNPTNGTLTITLGFIPEENAKCEIFDSSGSLIAQTNFEGSQIHMDLSAHNRGLYFIRVVDSNRIYFEKIVLQ